MLFGLAMFTTLWFWVAAVMLGTIIYAVYNEEFQWPLIGALVGVATLHWFSDIPVWLYIKTNYATMLTYVAYYLVIGVVWSFVKWYMFLLREKDSYTEMRDKFFKEMANKADQLAVRWSKDEETVIKASEIKAKFLNGEFPNEKAKQAWKSKIEYKEFPPKASTNKSRITTWMIYWTFSMVGTFFGDWLKDLFNFIYNLFGNVYDKISHSVFGKFEEDFK